jgi:hypothetical protein
VSRDHAGLVTAFLDLFHFCGWGRCGAVPERATGLKVKSSELRGRVAHQVHRPWEGLKYPGCGLVDNAPWARFTGWSAMTHSTACLFL